MKKLSVCVLFGGVSPEHEVSLRSAESVLNNLDKEKYNIFPVGITKTGEWILYGGRDYSKLPTGEWQHCPENRRAAISPVRGQGLLNFEGDCVVRERIDVVFPVLHGENGEDGSIQGLLQLAGLPYVGPGVAASATCMDKTLTKLVADRAGIRQAAWRLVTARELANNPEAVLDGVEKAFSYPMFIKPAGTGSSVGVSKAKNREALLAALTMLLALAGCGGENTGDTQEHSPQAEETLPESDAGDEAEESQEEAESGTEDAQAEETLPSDADSACLLYTSDAADE